MLHEPVGMLSAKKREARNRMRHCLLGVMIVFVATARMAAEPIDFARQVEPILTAHCVKCHGQAKAQGNLRLDSMAKLAECLVVKPQLIVAGKPDASILYQRLVLPVGQPKRMPKAADPLAAESLRLVHDWIEQGARLQGARAHEPVSAAAPPLASLAANAGEHDSPPDLPDVAPAAKEALQRLSDIGARCTPLCAGSNLLEVSFAGRAEPIGDSEIALLQGVAEQVVALNLAGARATPAGLAPLAQLTNLRSLHLEHSNVNDQGLAPLSSLQQLAYLNLYDTPITDAGVSQLARLRQLKKLYVWQTQVSYEGAQQLEKAIPSLIVNLGYDHPVVARKRLMKELEAAKKEAETAKAALVTAERQLERAKRDTELSGAALSELEKQLQSLDASSASP